MKNVSRAENPKIERVTLSEIRGAEYNANVMTERQLDGLGKSIKRFGFVQPLVLNRRGESWAEKDRGLVLVAGHQRFAELRKIGRATCDAYILDLNAVDEKAANAALNNRGANDPARLGSILRDLRAASADLEPLGLETREIERAIRASTALMAPAPGDDEVPEPPTAARSVVGDVYQLGPHRLMCGDSTRDEDVRRLMLEDYGRAPCVFTDPPYAIYGSSSGLSASITDDKIVRPFFRDTLIAAQAVTRINAAVFVCCDWRSWASWWEVAKQTHLDPKNMVVWDKGGAGLGSNFANTHELIAYFVHASPQKMMRSDRKAGIRAILSPNILRFPRVNVNEKRHNASKPIDLIRKVLGLATDAGDVVVDLFGGGGSTLVAAHREGRAARIMEIDPAWCDVIRTRWENLEEGLL